MIHTYSIANDTALGIVDGYTLQEQIKGSAITTPLDHIETEGDVLKLIFQAVLSQADTAICDSVVHAHAGQTSAQQVANYLHGQVFPFIDDLIAIFTAENINLGITQSGKTGSVLGLFSKAYPCPDVLRPISLKNCFDTGSLYSARDVLQYLRNNPMEYSGLSPFVTDARLLSLKNKIETFLGLPLST